MLIFGNYRTQPKYYVDKLRRRQIARIIIKNRRTIHRWIKRFCKNDIAELRAHPRSGRSAKVNDKKSCHKY